MEEKSSKPKSMAVFFFEHGMPVGSWECDMINDDDDLDKKNSSDNNTISTILEPTVKILPFECHHIRIGF